jgi:hypothetical protein
MTTTPSRILLICPCMGRYQFTRDSKRPTTASTVTIVTGGISFLHHANQVFQIEIENDELHCTWPSISDSIAEVNVNAPNNVFV